MVDYLDELDMKVKEEYDKLLEMCQKLISLFRWEEEFYCGMDEEDEFDFDMMDEELPFS